jgi:hypothetical protein
MLAQAPPQRLGVKLPAQKTVGWLWCLQHQLFQHLQWHFSEAPIPLHILIKWHPRASVDHHPDCMGAKCLAWYKLWTINQLREVCLWHIPWRRAWDWPFFWFYLFSHFLIHNFYFCAILQWRPFLAVQNVLGRWSEF